jgi:hypothetical protein
MRPLKVSLITILMIVPAILISGCTDKPIEDIVKGPDMADDIWISLQVRWRSPPEEDTPAGDTYALFPTLITEDGKVLRPLFGNNNFSKGRFPVSGRNFSIVDTIHGPCLRWNISVGNTQSAQYMEGDVLRTFEVTSAFVPYVSHGERIYYNRSDFSGIGVRFFGHGPGLSIWDEEKGSVFTWSYIDSKAYSLGFKMVRGDGRRDIGHALTIFDCYKDMGFEERCKNQTCILPDDTFVLDGPGWHRIQVDRYVDDLSWRE